MDGNIREKRKITGDRKKQKIDGEVVVPDRLSMLPDPIIHRIFNFFRCAKDMVRTTILSKNWQRVFYSYQSFDFNQKYFRIANGRNGNEHEREAQRQNFKEYVDRSLAARLDHVERIDKFKLYVNNVDESLMISIHHWLRTAMAKNVRELDVRVPKWKGILHSVDSTHLNSLTFLKLGGDSLSGLAAMKMCNLRGISIKDAMFVDVAVIKKIEENCPLLEDLRLVGCPRLLHLQISSLVKLRRVEVQKCKGLRRIEIASSNLETFWYHRTKNQIYFDLKSCENLKNLTLKDRRMSESAFEDCILMFPLLEKLVLQECNMIEKLRMCKVALKSLSLIQCAKLVEVDIDASKLHSFQYNGRVMSFPFINNAPRLENFSFDLRGKRSHNNHDNYLSLNFDESKGFKLMIYSKQSMKIFEDARRSDLHQSELCKVEFTASSSKVVKTVENWLRECHGKSLVVASSKGEVLKLVNTLVTGREDNQSCCAFLSNKCWRHYIQDVKVSSFVADTSFDFKWKEEDSSKLE